ncbi:MAG: BrnT family toxin [Betaproteobacteria bacterium]
MQQASAARFEWDLAKDRENRRKHGVGFAEAQYAFGDPRRVIARDVAHGNREARYFCFGELGAGVLTVRFTWRDGVIRIFGAGYWRKGRVVYERKNQIHE